MSEKQEASPRPWRVDFTPYQGWKQREGALCDIVAANGQNVYSGPAAFPALTGATYAEAVANAELIVRAVNERDELIAALEGLLARFPEQVTADGTGRIGFTPELIAAVGTARAALAKARTEGEAK